MTPGVALADQVCRIGREAGLDSVAVCHAGPFPEVRRVLEERKAAGWSGGMQFTYRNPARSSDPRVTLPGARALVVGARSYRRQGPGIPGGGPHGRVARYSWIDHYDHLRRGLAAVADRLLAEGWRARVLADDNALVDRAAAVRAGLGWYGKNANVLLPGAGSWFVIGSVVTDAPIDPADARPPVADGCGACQRCIRDCPTGALVGPGQLDARRCLAWLLQAPGVFPVEYRVALGDRMYGCDECQERCPVNRRADRVDEAPAAEAGAQTALAVIEVLASDDDALERLVGRWYIPGREMRYVRRNALVVLANTGSGDDPQVEAALRRFLCHPDPLLRAHAVWCAGRLGRRDLLACMAGENDATVHAEMERWIP